MKKAVPNFNAVTVCLLFRNINPLKKWATFLAREKIQKIVGASVSFS